MHREVAAVRLSTRNVFLPDLACFTSAQMGRLAESHAPFAPALVVEALSPWSADRDVGPKFAAYEEHGVQEYWFLDPDIRAKRFLISYALRFPTASTVLSRSMADSTRGPSGSSHARRM